MQEHIAYLFVLFIKTNKYAYSFPRFISCCYKCDKPFDCHIRSVDRYYFFLKNEIRRFTGGYSITNIRKLRATFGTYLLLGLEFLIASDILKTVLEPTLNELALLGGIVVLRTILSVFLNKEIKELESEEK